MAIKSKDQIIREQAEKIEDLEETLELYNKMIKTLLANVRLSAFKAETAEKECAEIYFTKFLKSRNEFGFESSSTIDDILFFD